MGPHTTARPYLFALGLQPHHLLLVAPVHQLSLRHTTTAHSILRQHGTQMPLQPASSLHGLQNCCTAFEDQNKC